MGLQVCRTKCRYWVSDLLEDFHPENRIYGTILSKIQRISTFQAVKTF